MGSSFVVMSWSRSTVILVQPANGLVKRDRRISHGDTGFGRGRPAVRVTQLTL
jgi:hypothetical protein